MIDGVIFDLDGVLLQSEEVWNDAKRELTLERGGRWHECAPRAMMGMSSPEWTRYMQDELGLSDPAETISAEVVRRLEQLYRTRLPLLPGAREAVERLGEQWPLGLASSSNRPIIDLVLELADLERFFGATVSSEEVARGKPAPDVYLETARRLGVAPERGVAIEDSENGILSARSARLRVVALPNSAWPPSAQTLSLADAVLTSLDELTPELIENGGRI